MKNLISVAVETVRLAVIFSILIGGLFLMGVAVMQQPELTQNELEIK